MALIFVVLASVLAWVGLGHPFQPSWAGLSLILLGWASGLRWRVPRLVALGFIGLMALAAYCVVMGNVPVGLGVLGWALLAGDAAVSPGSVGEAFPRRLLRSVGVVGSGIAFAFAVSFLRLSFNFWALMGGLLLAWLVLWTWLREALQPPGGEAKGNRSTSRSIR